MITRAFLIWIAIAAAEIFQGILRVRFLNRRVGDHRARQIAVFTGSVIILVIAWFAVHWIDATTITRLLIVGSLWLALMLSLDVFFGRLVFHASWNRIAADFDPRRGGFLGFGMLVLFFAPLIVATVRGFI